jgi:hypothetical protein
MTDETLGVDGAWEILSYVVGDRATPVQGVLLFTMGHWATLYFVPEAKGPWGSAESGLFEREGGNLTFHHRQTFQAGGGRELSIDQGASRVEVCQIAREGETLKIQFPSGNTLHLRRPA